MSSSYGDLSSKYAKVAFVFVCHAALIVISIFVIYGIERLFHWLWDVDHEPLVFGRVPLQYLFQALDVGIVCVFGYRAMKEINELLKG